MPIAATDEQLALQASIRDWAERAGPLALVRGLEPGLDPGSPEAGGPEPGSPGPASGGPCWGDLAGLGVFSIALPAAAGGAGGTVADLAAALEELTLALVPGPVLPTLLAGLVLAPHAGLPAVPPLLTALATGAATATVSLPAATLTGAWQAGGRLRVTGEIGPVLSGGAARPAARGRGDRGRRGVVLRAGRPSGDHGDRAHPGRLLPAAGHPPVHRSAHRPRPDPGRAVHGAGARPGRDAVRGGSRRRGRLVLGHRRRVRPHPAPVRPAYRLLPGGQAPVRRPAVPG